METTAWIQPIKPPTIMAAITPTHGAYQTRAFMDSRRKGASMSCAETAAASAPKRMMPSSAMLTTPARSLNSPPRAANSSGVVARIMEEKSASISTVSMSTPLPCGGSFLVGVVLGGPGGGVEPGARIQYTLRQEAAGGDEEHDQREDHADDLAREVGEGDVEHRAAVLENPEEEGGEDDEDGLVGAQQRHGYAVEAVVGGDGLPQCVVLQRAAQHVVRGGQASQAPADGHGPDGVLGDAGAAVLGGAGREAHRPELVAPAGAEEHHMHERRGQ